jgi:hypothetical protein
MVKPTTMDITPRKSFLSPSPTSLFITGSKISNSCCIARPTTKTGARAIIIESIFTPL